MKVNLKIPSPGKATFVVKAKTYDEAADILAGGDYAACYEANPSYSSQPTNGDPIKVITLKAKPVITMPSWAGASKLKGEEKTCWDKMMKALKKHEMNHHKKWVEDAKKFKKKTEKDGEFPPDELAGKMQAFFTAAQATQDKYDTSTKNGQTEGVDLPYLD